MKKILIAGAAGGLGKEVLEELKRRGYYVKALAIDDKDASKIKNIADEVAIGDASDPETLSGIMDNTDIVFSALGKSVSLFSPDDTSFFEVDYTANKNLIDKAKESGVKRFVYISIYGSDKFGEFELAKVHRNVEKELFDSGMSYTIIRPVGMFTGLLDYIRMAKNGLIVTSGKGENKTNPIHEEDLAVLCADNIEEGEEIIEAGGPEIFTRNQIAELAREAVGDAVHIHIPEVIVEGSLPLVKMYNESFFDKLAFFNNVLTHDVVAPQYGSRKLKDYFEEMAGKVDADIKDVVK
jgi:uncharacterized protein YbjT (DUF2867 family)